MPVRILHKTVQPPASRSQSGRHIRKLLSVPRDHQSGPQGLDQIKRRRHFIEATAILDVTEHHPKTILPERICRNQGGGLFMEKDDRMMVVTRRCMNLPIQITQTHFMTGTKHILKDKSRTLLSDIQNLGLISCPVANRRRRSRRNQGHQIGVFQLKRRIPTTMIAVQMGVHKQRKRPSTRPGLDKRQRLIRMGAITAVNQGQ